MPRPPFLPTHLTGPLAAALDRAVTRTLGDRHDAGQTRLDDDQLIEHATAAARRVTWLTETRPGHDHFEPAATISPLSTEGFRERYRTLTWQSSHRPVFPEVHALWHWHAENAIAHVRYFQRGRGRPVAILVHGYLGGSFNLEQRIWPVSWLDAQGFDVALFTLPFHAARAARVSGGPLFPRSDILFNIEAFRQSVIDLRDLIGWFRRRGHSLVGLLGMSLGGYVCALTATLESELSFLVPIVPLACLAEFAREQGRVPRGFERALSYRALLASAYQMVSPLSRIPCIPKQRVLVVAGKADHITPPSHARRLAQHFSAPIEAWSGGHLLQFGRSKSWTRVGRFLREVSDRGRG